MGKIMKNLSINHAKTLAKKYLRDNKNIDPYHYIHTLKVVEAVKIISEDKKVNGISLEISAWTHDIGYALKNLPNKNKYHARDSLRLIKKEGFRIDEIIYDCILNHGGKKKPKTIEGKIFQIAVKFNIIDKDFLRFLIQRKAGGKEIGFLRERAKSALKMLKRLHSLKLEDD